MHHWPSVIVAKVTEFLPYNNYSKPPEINWSAYEKHCRFLIEQGVGILTMGTTGESPVVTGEQHKQIIQRTVKVAHETNPYASILAGTGSNATWEAIQYTQSAKEAGADGALLITPYYNAPSSFEMWHGYFEPIAQTVLDFPLMPYLISGRTGSCFIPADLAVLVENFPNFFGVKYAEPTLEHLEKIRKYLPNSERFQIFSGDDSRTLEIMRKFGGKGVISVIGNILPCPIKQMCDSALRGDYDKAEKIQSALMPLFKLVTVLCTRSQRIYGIGFEKFSDKFRNPDAINVMMAGLGLEIGCCIAPLVAPPANIIKEIRGELTKVYRSNPEFFISLATYYNLDFDAQLANDEIWDNLAYRE